jgi:8-oxo-dGTP diphosphatase
LRGSLSKERRKVLCRVRRAGWTAHAQGSTFLRSKKRKDALMAGPETPKLMVDTVVPSEEGEVLLIRRASDPYEGQWALPGGFVEVGETLEDAAARETEEETGLSVEIVRLVGVYSDPDRDPRGHNVSCAYLASVREGEPEAASDAAEVAFLDPSTVDLAFDHEKIIANALSGGAPLTY